LGDLVIFFWFGYTPKENPIIQIIVDFVSLNILGLWGLSGIPLITVSTFSICNPHPCSAGVFIDMKCSPIDVDREKN